MGIILEAYQTKLNLRNQVGKQKPHCYFRMLHSWRRQRLRCSCAEIRGVRENRRKLAWHAVCHSHSLFRILFQFQDVDTVADVVVVGAGLSGLSAAVRIREVSTSNLHWLLFSYEIQFQRLPTANIILLEARNSSGGRIMDETLNTANGPMRIDIGT